MTLNIVKEYRVDSDLNDVYISAEMLKSPATHLFLASNAWDSVNVEVCKELSADALQYIPILSKDIKVVLPDEVDDRVMQILIALFPDKRGTIRRVFMAKGDMSEVVPICTAL